MYCAVKTSVATSVANNNHKQLPNYRASPDFWFNLIFYFGLIWSLAILSFLDSWDVLRVDIYGIGGWPMPSSSDTFLLPPAQVLSLQAGHCLRLEGWRHLLAGRLEEIHCLRLEDIYWWERDLRLSWDSWWLGRGWISKDWLRYWPIMIYDHWPQFLN